MAHNANENSFKINKSSIEEPSCSNSVSKEEERGSKEEDSSKPSTSSSIIRFFGFSSRRVSKSCDLSTTQYGETSSCLKKYEEKPCADEDPIIKILVVGSVENECTSNFFVGDLHIADKDIGSCVGGKTPFVSYKKGYYKS